MAHESPPFETADISLFQKEKVPLSHQIFGRDEETLQLAQILKESLETKRLVLIEGPAGIGKSALAHSLIPLTELEDGFFIEGKFNAFQLNTPYAAPLRAIESLLEQVNKLDENRKSIYRKKIKTLLGDRLNLLYDPLPLLKTLMGINGLYDDFKDSELIQDESSLFLEGIELLLSLFANGKFPLVLLIDEMEWADKASGNFLKNLIRSNEEIKILIILTFQNDQVKRGSTLAQILDDLESSKHPLIQFNLSPLEEKDVKKMIQNQWEEKFELSQSILTDLILHQSNGNPFYIKQIIDSLLDDQEDKVLNKGPVPAYYKTLEALLSNRLQKLSFRTQEILKLAACSGGYFNERLISQLSPYNLDEIEEAFLEMSEKKILEKTPLPQRKKGSESTWQFSHDLLAKAAENEVDPQIKTLCHLEIARHLLKGASVEEFNQNAYAISYQMNLAKKLVREESDKTLALRANTIAAKNAMSSGSYSIGETYIRSALEFLPDNKWNESYKEMYQLYLLLGESTYLQGRFEEAEQHLNFLLKQITIPIDKLDPLILLIRQSIAVGEYSRAIKYGDQALSLLGIPISKWGFKFSLFKEYLLCRLKALRDPLPKFKALPAMDNQTALKQVKVLSILIPAAYLKERDKLPYYTFKAFNLIMRYGMHPLGPTILTTWAVVFNRCKRNINLICNIGTWALSLSETKSYRANLPAVLFLYGQFIAPFRHTIKESLSYFEKGYIRGVSEGDLIYALFSLNQGALVDFILEPTINDLEVKLLTKLRFLEKYKDNSRGQILIALIQTCRALKGETNHPTSFESKDFLERNYFRLLREASFNTSLFTALTAKIALCYLFDNTEEALRLVEKAKPYSVYLTEHLTYTEFLFFQTLCLIKLFPKKDPFTKKQFKKEIYKNLFIFENLDKESRGRFHGKYRLIKAEVCVLFGDKLEAIKNYEQALILAREAGVRKTEAIINERFAVFWFNEGLMDHALRFLEIAESVYKNWGATAKVEEVKKRLIEWGKKE